ncbi:MAG: DNA mismatch repair endonuclease MutL [Lachnospiraceae bacterium]|nr:DNA mismatch repair endonuclease MutL [Lachnospiraceae bacterium]
MIKLLDKTTIDKIAAGEVIERPSSVVKELLENSIDANATSITVEIKEGGISFIRVTDNGDGIPKEQVRTAYMRHATSKIEDASDLESIASLGFRGEALSTIAAVSQAEMITKTASDLVGVKYVIHGGEEVEYKEVGVPDGTTIVVRNLFFNTPARKKFLKTPMTEGSYINDLVLRIALSHPEISFKLIINGQTKLDTSGNGKLKDVLYQLFGRDITSNIIEVDYEQSDIKISGYIGKPFISRGNRGLENYFINKRYIKSNIVNRAIEEGYKTYVMQHKFPFTALFIELPLDKCDVNVHPTKMEFKYHNERALFEAVTKAVREALSFKELIPKAEYDKTQAKVIKSVERPAEPYEARRVINSVGVPKVSALSNSTGSISTMNPASQSKINGYSASYSILEQMKKQDEEIKKESDNQTENRDVEHSSKQKQTTVIKDAGYKFASSPYAKTSTSVVADSSNRGVDISNLLKDDGVAYQTTANSEYSNNAVTVQNANEEMPVVNNDTPTINTEKDGVKLQINVRDEVITGTQTTLFDEKFLSEEARRKHRLIGQVFGTYWLIEYDNNLYIMDQHAAHEKVKYEELMAQLDSREVFSQQLMPPMVVTVSYAEREAILNNYDLFMEFGYDIVEFGGNEFKINAVPTNLYGLHGREMFMEFVSSLIDNAGYMSNEVFVKKLSTMACKAAIKGNMKISFAEADALIEQLLKLENPYTCPHGRPTIISMSERELEKKFKRVL